MPNASKNLSDEPKVFSLWASVVFSLTGWLFTSVGTIVLSLFGFFFLWPLSLIFQRANGELPHRISQVWARLIERTLPFWEIRTEGLERIPRGKSYIIVSNHQSLLDILILLAKLPLHFKFIAKRELFWVPFLGWHLALARYITLKRGDRESGRQCLESARQWLRRGVSVVFFPEGTRSPDGKIHEFKAGAFKLALEEKKEILSLVIRGTREAIPKRSWRLRKRSTLSLKVLEPVSTARRSLEDLESLREEIRNLIVSEFERPL